MVSGSAKHFFNFSWSIEITSFESSFFTVLYLWQLCQDLPLYNVVPFQSLLSYHNAHRLSAQVLAKLEYPPKNKRSYLVSSLAWPKVINLDSIVDQAMRICFEDFHGTTIAPSSIKTYPFADLSLFKQVSHSDLYPSSKVGYVVQCNS